MNRDTRSTYHLSQLRVRVADASLSSAREINAANITAMLVPDSGGIADNLTLPTLQNVSYI